MMLNDLLTFSDVQALTKASRPTLYRWLKAGTFPTPIHIGPNSVRFKRADIDQWLERLGADGAKEASV